LALEQKDCEGAIEQHEAKIEKYNQQLVAVKKNEEYQALLHEIDQEKKQIGLKEERILFILDELEQARARLNEDKKRISEESADIDRQCAEIDQELEEAIAERKELEAQRAPFIESVDAQLYKRYEKLRSNITQGNVVVPMLNEVCTGCHMGIRAQIVNEVLEGSKIHVCQHCARILYHPDNVDSDSVESEAQQAG
jgi:predicted  nucleic acid-binding Zn-ribbon protein